MATLRPLVASQGGIESNKPFQVMDTFDKAFSMAAAICSRQESCQSDIIQLLRKSGVDENVALTVIRKLKEDDYINEARYAGSFARDKFRFNKWGKVKIAAGLRQKQVDLNAINAALQTIDNDSYMETLRHLLTRKSMLMKQEQPAKTRAALTRYALSKGFAIDEIIPALESL